MVARAVTKKITDLPTYTLNNNTGNILYTEDGVAYQYPMSGVVKKSFTFTVGGTLRSNSDRISDGTYLYYWTGEYPVTVSPGSTVDTLGGLGEGYWSVDGDARLRTSLATTGGDIVKYQVSTNSVLRGVGAKLSEYLTFEDYGAYGEVDSDGIPTTDETAQIKQALADALTTGKQLKATGNQRYLISSTLEIYPWVYELDMGQAIFVASNDFTGTELIKVFGVNATTYDASVAFSPNKLTINAWGQFSPGHGMRHPRNTNTSEYLELDGVVFQGDDLAGSRQISFMEIRCNVWGFRDNIVISGSHVYGLHFYHPSVRGAWRRGWYFNRVADFGENFQIIGGCSAECTNYTGDSRIFYVPKNANITLGIYGHSTDYSDFIGQFDSGSIYIAAPFPENSSTNPWFLINYDNDSTGEPTAFYMHGSIANRGNKSSDYTGTAYLEPINGRKCFISTTGRVVVTVRGQIGRYSDTTTTFVLPDLTTNTNPPLKIDLDGSWFVNGSDGTYQGLTYPARQTNRIYNGRFPNGDLTGIQYSYIGTTLSNSLSIISDEIQSGGRTLDDIGTYAAVMSSGVDSSSVNYSSHLYFPFPVEPGKTLITALHYKQMGAFTGYFVVIREAAYLNNDGSELWRSLGETSIYGGTPSKYLCWAYRMMVPEGVTKMRLHLRFYYSGGNAVGTMRIKDVNAWCM